MTPATFPSVLDSSILAGFKSCAQKGFKEYFSHWKPKDQSVHLHAGAAFAKGMEVARLAFYVEGKEADIAVAEGLGALLAAYGNFECPADSAKSSERMAGAFEFYFHNYPLTHEDYPPIQLPSGKRGIEFSFVEPLDILHPVTGEPLLYSGRLDALLHFAGGTFICDEKTTSSLGATWSRQWDLRSQFTGYAWGCQRNGIKVDGVIVRGVSVLKTKYETQQAISYRPEWQIDRWYRELQFHVNQMIEQWKLYTANGTEFIHNLDHACAEYGGCTFRQICSMQPGENQDQWLEQYYEQREWNPITRQEAKL